MRKAEQILEALDSAPVECDGLLQLSVGALTEAGYVAGKDFDSYCGQYHCDQHGSIPHHYWLVLYEAGDAIVWDYRIRYWLGNEASHGRIGKLGETGHVGQKIHVPTIPGWLVDILKTPIPTAAVPGETRGDRLPAH
ncbi:hypothetical protein [Ferrimonas marina]|uniref:Uncharacterized protein n=1 Tax=Ferrimonas marina TaxID=299255 RepID=A0A1M5TS77_9GAMM|nr:hypothetical protein [Ferrimonas marina]SHH53574.1 hypothetical protein SAMN02745129_2257 [Ferrimonas marina]